MPINKESAKVPLAIFAYRRPRHLKSVFEATLLMERFELVQPLIFVDGPKSVEERELVAECLELANRFASLTGGKVIKSEGNKGLSKAIIEGVNSVFEEHDSIIVLEDDLVPSRFFLEYALNGLRLYAKEFAVSSIHGYLPNINSPNGKPFFRRGADCWGWATWKDRWNSVEWNSMILLDEVEKRKLKRKLNLNGAYCYSCMLERQVVGEIDSWAIRWHTSMFLQNRLALYPNRSLIQNIGFDGSGRHGGKNSFYFTKLSDQSIPNYKIYPKESGIARRRMARHLRKTFGNTFSKKLIKVIKNVSDDNVKLMKYLRKISVVNFGKR